MAAPVVFAPCREPVLYGADFVHLNALAGGNPDFEPLVVKAAYVFGTMLDLFESVSVLLGHKLAWQVTYRSAFGVFASAVELLGRCISGNATPRGKTDLAHGLQFVFPVGLATPTAHYTVITWSSSGTSPPMGRLPPRPRTSTTKCLTAARDHLGRQSRAIGHL